jgi:hypothetical protein
MNKDVIYIDIEDDITAIIGKVKSAASKIVALVPPKRAGVLQSAVNLKLLQKAALGADKRVVLITNDHSLMALAAGLKLPVARNLQSRPEIPDLSAPETSAEEIINGQELPVGDVAASLGSKADAPGQTELAGGMSGLGGAAIKEASKTTPPKSSLASKLNIGKNKLKVPNFDLFRKRLFIFGTLGILLVSFLVWAMAFAPHATVTISAKTSNINIDRTLTLNPAAAASDPAKLTLKPNVQQLKKSVATEFDATGTKDIGSKAKGTITIRNCDYADGELTLPAGTKFTGANGKVYLSTKAVDVPGRIPPTSTCTLSGAQAGKKDVAVEATAIGPEYNVGGQSYTLNVAGKVDGIDTEGMTGGTHETVTVVSQADVDKAKQELTTQNAEDAKAELKKQFKADDLIIEESYMVESSQPASSPAVGEQASQAKLTLETTYTYVAISRTDVKKVLQAAIDDVLKNKTDQQTYTLGENSITFQTFRKLDGGGFSAKLNTNGSIGPKIDTDALAKQLVGKRYGEIQAVANDIPGVDHVEITLSPFWVTTAPSADKIDIKFSVAPNNE